MKKITRVARMLIVLLSIFLLSAGAWAQTTLLTEGFEGGSLPTGWVQNFALGTTAWTYGAGGHNGNPAAAHTGNNNALLYYAGHGVKTELITPVLDFTGYSAGRVSFWQTHAFWSPDQDSLTVLYRTTTGGAWKKLGLYLNNMATWTQTTLTIPTVSATTQICFRGCAYFGYGVCLDDILVQGLAYGTLSGTVKSSVTPFTGLASTVTVTGYTPVSSVAVTGAYTVPNILAGPITVTVTNAAGYVGQTKTASISGSATTTLNFSLDPIPATITGTITNAATGALLEGVEVTFGAMPSGAVNGINTTRSILGGTYVIPVFPAGTQLIHARKPGFLDFVSTSTITVTPPGTAILNIAMIEALNPPSVPFPAALNGAQTAVNLQWGLPVGQYMLIYDDGVPENWTVWATSGNKNATKFTPVGYPAIVTGGTINIGTIYNYPTGSNPLVPFKVGIYDASGTNGTPGALIGSLLDVTPTTYGVVNFTLAAPVTINTGSFYIAMVQGGNAPNAAGLAIDTTSQQLRSYSQFGTGPWLPTSGNFMIRAILSGSGGPLLTNAMITNHNAITATAIPGAIYQYNPGTVTGYEGQGTTIQIGGDPKSVIGYEVFRLVQGQEGNETLWVPIGTTLPDVTSLVYTAWPSLDCGAYKWAVKAQYTGNRWSSAIFSNIIPKCWTANVTVDLALSCDSTPRKNTFIELRETTYDSVYSFLTTDNSPSHVFHNVWKGTYRLTVRHFGYTDYVSAPTLIMADYTFTAAMLLTKFSPSGLHVNDRTLLATWNKPVPIVEFFKENFSSGSFTTNGWVPGGTNWAVSSANGHPAPSAQFSWTPDVTNYSISLTSKSIAGIHSPIMRLKYDLFLNNYGTTALNQMAIELWDGTTWHLLKNYDNSTGADIAWTTDDLDVSAYTDISFKIRFRAYGGDSQYIDNWNIDNIVIYGMLPPGPDPCLLGYNLYLNTQLETNTMDTSYVIPPGHVQYGTAYHACVLAIYPNGYSGTSCYDFTAKFLCPPTAMTGTAVENSAYLTWTKPSCTGGSGPVPQWIKYDNGTYSNAIGLNGGGTFDVAARFAVSQIAPLAGGSVTKVQFYPNGAGTFKVRVWKGANAATLLADQTVTSPTIGAWNVITLTTPVPIDITQELWIGYEVTHANLVYPASIDAATASDGFSNMIYLAPGPWASLTSVTSPPIQGDWMVEGYVEPSKKSLDMPTSLVNDMSHATNIANAILVAGNLPSPNGGGREVDAPVANPTLLGYNVYRDGNPTQIVYIANPNTLNYLDENLEPGLYTYTVTGWYNVAPIAPGHDNSLPAGPVEVNIQYGRPLPFYEPWDMGVFSFNAWKHNGNWSVNTGFGNPAPTADFSWQPGVTNYDTLWIETPVLSAAAYSCAKIWLDFDYKLLDRNHTGAEFLRVEEYIGGTYKKVAEFTNNGDVDWNTQHFELKATQGKAFKVRFRAHGANSLDILHWYVDNIHVYAVCKPALNLTVVQDPVSFDAHLSWHSPKCTSATGNPLYEGFESGTFPPQFFTQVITNTTQHWVQSDVTSSLGVHTGNGAAQCWWDYAHQDEWLIAHNIQVTGNLTFWGNVWLGSTNGDHYYVKVSTDHGATWTVLLDFSAMAGNVRETWVSPYEVDLSAYADEIIDIAWQWVDGDGAGLWYATAIDDLYIGSKKIATNSLEHISKADPNAYGISKVSGISKEEQNRISKIGVVSSVPYDQIHPAKSITAFQGYDVYRSDSVDNNYHVINSAIVTDTVYVDPDLTPNLEYYYYVLSRFEECTQSTPSDTVTIIISGIDERVDGKLSIYPNPANNVVNMVSTSNIKTVEVLNYLGQTVYMNRNVGLKKMQLNVSGYKAGVYFIKITTATGIKTTKITVLH